MLSTRSTVLLLAVLLVAACRMPPPVYMIQGRPQPTQVPYAPPAPRLEVPPAPPDESYVWQDGYWSWDGSEYS